jgi:23S rRNA pseudouridine2605 synthase
MAQNSKQIRINKYLSACGLGSRRSVEEYIEKKQVFINGRLVTDFAQTVDPEKDTVKCAGQFVKLISKTSYLILNKPTKCITTSDDPQGRLNVMNLIPQRIKALGVFPVGRLDRDTEGLLILTNDGEFAHRLMHPSFESTKEYIVSIDRPLEEKDRLKMEAGLKLREFHARPCTVEVLDEKNPTVRMVIHEGKKHQIRIIFKKFQYRIRRLKRISIGPLKLGRLGAGDFRELRPKEIKEMKKYLGMNG